jgi:RHS repeat-associated protein
MKAFLFTLLLPTLLFCAWDDLFIEKHNPIIRDNVNVISGNLELLSEDILVEGEDPLKIIRTYSSSGSSERVLKKDINLKKFNLIPQMESGWSFLPHLQLLVDPRINGGFGLKVHVKEANGEITIFQTNKVQALGTITLYAESKTTPISGVISGLNNPKNHELEINYKKGKATLKLADGSRRIYKGRERGIVDHLADKAVINVERDIRNYLLQEEISASGQVTCYEYIEGIEKGIIKILMSKKNPAKTKTYSWILLEKIRTKTPFKYKVTTSDQREVFYEGMVDKDCEYLTCVDNKMNISDEYSYTKLRSSRGSSLKKIKSFGKDALEVEYYKPEKSSDEDKWKKKPYRVPIHIDKVKSISVASSLKASFEYKENLTLVRDALGILTKYHFDKDKLQLIEYFDEKDVLYSAQKFVWESNRLIAKYVTDKIGNILLGKLLSYDSFGNIVFETLIGNISGECKDPIIAREDSTPIGGEKYSKKYTYDEKTHFLTSEREDNGLLTTYSYLEGTNLVAEKIQYIKNQIIQKEIYTYDEDNLLTSEIIDDGISRLEKRYIRDIDNKRVVAVEDNFTRTEYIYNSQNLIASELVSDHFRRELYSIHYEYDKFGRLISKTNPEASKNYYTYSPSGNILSSKELGSSKIEYFYDDEDRVIKTISNGKTSKTCYNSKGWIIEKSDENGFVTNYEYDCFGRVIKTILPETLDENKDSYRGIIECFYDIFSNPIFCKNAKGEIKKTTFNSLQMPVLEIFDDESSTKTLYSLAGKIKTFINKDLSETSYEHDSLGRLICKKTGYDIETYEYSGTKLICSKDETGLITYFDYDSNGNLKEKKALDRSTLYFYNHLGVLEKTKIGDLEKNQKMDALSRLIYQDENGENQTHFFYDEEGRRNKILKKTSASDAVDLIKYDVESRIISYKDPLGNETKFEYLKNNKITADPDGNIQIESFDPLGRIIKIERKGLDGKTYSCTENFYDRSGNLAKKQTHVYEKDVYTKTHEITWNYDYRGLITKESTNDKSSAMIYDKLGRLEEKTLFDGVKLHYEYHPNGRLKRLHSSDEKIDYVYEYENLPKPTSILNQITKKTLKRAYNLFGDIVYEKNEEGAELRYDYDNIGRKTALLLPDASSIEYQYEKNHMVKVSKLFQGKVLYFHTYDEFDPCGHVKKESFIFGLGENKTTRNALEQIKSITSPFHREEIEYNKKGLVVSAKNTLIQSKAKKFKYDAIDQLSSEGDIIHNFNSMGNCIEDEVGQSNELSSRYLYDENGYPIKCLKTNTQYIYDPLGRLIEIKEKDGKSHLYNYDAYSRLSKKTFVKNKNIQDVRIFIYDDELEIGSMDMKGKFREFRMLGLGIEADIGATVAIEVDDQVYLALNDFHGNITGLISKNGVIISCYEFDSFGNEKSPNCSNPWRFSSKRKDGDFYYFGKRFLDPKNKRWLTPDPLGYFDSPNPYLFNLNSPQNRLDIFGLYSIPENGFYFEPSRSQNGHYFPHITKPHNIVFCKGILSQSPMVTPVDIVVISGDFHKIKFTPEEKGKNVSNLIKHFNEIIPKEENKIGLVTFQNGINTSFKEFLDHCGLIYEKIPEGTTFIGIHNKSLGLLKDIHRARKEMKKNLTTKKAIETGQFTGIIADCFGEIQSSSFWVHIPYSEGGALFNLGYTTLTENQKQLMKNQLIVFAIAPATPIAKDRCYESISIFSNKDWITGKSAKKFLNDPGYNLNYTHCLAKRKEMTAFFTDHSFSSPTYQMKLDTKFSELKSRTNEFCTSRR